MNLGALCPARLAPPKCMMTRLSRSSCSVSKFIRQSKSVNESCTKDDPLPSTQWVIRLAGRIGMRFDPASQRHSSCEDPDPHNSNDRRGDHMAAALSSRGTKRSSSSETTAPSLKEVRSREIDLAQSPSVRAPADCANLIADANI